MRKRPAQFTRFDDEELKQLVCQTVGECLPDVASEMEPNRNGDKIICVSDMVDLAHIQIHSYRRLHEPDSLAVARDEERITDRRSQLRSGRIAADVLRAFTEFRGIGYEWATELCKKALSDRFSARRGRVYL